MIHIPLRSAGPLSPVSFLHTEQMTSQQCNDVFMHMKRGGAGGMVVVNMVADLPPGTSQQLLQEIKLSPKTSPQIPS